MTGIEVGLFSVIAILVLIYAGMYVPVALGLVSFVTVWLLRGSVDAGAISNEDYDALSEASRARLTVLDHTASIPRRLVSVRRGLPEAVTRALSAALVAMADGDPVALDDAPRAWSWRFDPLTPDVAASIEQLATFIEP